MITIFPYSELGEARYGWLHARYHFSFARYIDRNKMGFPPLRVWNDDIIQPQTGFPMHSHQNMEIITYVKEGAITHEDSLGNKGRTEAGQIQVMSAGTGIIHSEYNLEDVETKLFQIWIEPGEVNIPPRWETIQLDEKMTSSSCRILASGKKEDQSTAPIMLYQDASLLVISLEEKESTDIPMFGNRHGYGVVSDGSFQINDVKISKGDGVYIQDEPLLKLQGLSRENTLIFTDLPKQ